MSLERSISNLNVGTRIVGGFAAILLLVMMVAAVSIIGERSTGAQIEHYSVKAELAIRISDITAEIGSMRRNMLRFAVTGDAEELAKAQASHAKLSSLVQGIVDKGAGTGLDQIEEIKKVLADYGQIIQQIETLRRKRDQLVNGDLAASGKNVSDNLAQIIKATRGCPARC